MSKFIISGFSDEIDKNIVKQFEHLNKLGIKYFEPRGINGKNISALTDAEALQLKQKMREYGISASSIGSPIGKIAIKDKFTPHLESLKRVIDIAHKLDTNYIRIFSFFMPKGEDPANYRNEVMERIFRMIELAEAEDVILLHENEKEIYGDTAKRCADIFETVKSPSLCAVFDPANFIQCAQKVFPDAYEMLKPYIKYIHIKDALENGEVVPAGMGTGNIKDILSALKADGYDGFLSLEPHLGNFTGFAELEGGTSIKSDVKSDAEKFTTAYNALAAILNTL